MTKFLTASGLLLALLTSTAARAGTVEQILDGYRQQGAGPFSATQGQALWQQSIDQRSCASCHTDDLRQPGRHAKTGKAIEPMAPSVNPRRLSDAAKVEKWLKRNCKWTYARECTPQERGDLLTYIQSQ
jgi:mono/diheme cytochrome c family protein